MNGPKGFFFRRSPVQEHGASSLLTLGQNIKYNNKIGITTGIFAVNWFFSLRKEDL